MEIRDLYNENKELTGETIVKGEAVPKGRYYITVVVWIQNDNGEFLIQKRSIQKDGMYGSTGGHAKTGESSIQAMMTEIREERGLKVEEKELELIYSGRSDRSQVFFDLYYLKKDFDIEDLVLQKVEVEFVEWYSIEKINQLAKNGLFLENHLEEFYRLINIFKERGITLE